jgi:hypothetical protein
MRRTLVLKNVSAFLTWIMLMTFLSLPAMGGSPALAPQDIALSEGGALVGQVVDPQGAIKAGSPVSLYEGKTPVAISTTDKQGMFVFQGVRGGLYQVTSGDAHGIYRLWSPGTAPPSAKPGVLLVSGNETVRGQAAGASFASLAPIAAVGGIVAAAVAIPIVVSSNNQRPASP